MQIKDAWYRHAIHSRRWRNLRHSILIENPLCIDCKAAGFISISSEAHHTVPYHPGDPEPVKEAQFFSKDNIVALCHACHQARHAALGKQSPEYYAEHTERAVKTAVEKFL